MDSSQTPLEESQHMLLNILHTFSFAHIVLPINETSLDPAKIIWQTLPTIPPTCKRVDKTYYVPSKDSDFFIFILILELPCHQCCK